MIVGYGKRSVYWNLLKVMAIAHFRVASSLCFKARLSAEPLIWEWFSILMQIKFWNITSGISAKYHVQIMLLFVCTTTCKSFVIFTCRYFKLSWNTTALSQSNCSNFSCSSIIPLISSTRQFSHANKLTVSSVC